MRGCTWLVPALLATGFALVPRPAFAAWPTQSSVNVPVCTKPLSQDEPRMVADGAGGVLLVWQGVDARSRPVVLAQHLDRGGNPLWPDDGIPVCVVPSRQQAPAIASDSSGGAIIVWQDNRTDRDWDVYAQRMSGSGAMLWDQDGVEVAGVQGDQLVPSVIADGRGGAIIAWRDLRADPESDLYTQSLDAAGRPRWTPGGTPLFAGSGTQLLRRPVPAGQGGAIFVWSNPRGSTAAVSVYAQLVDSMAVSAWGPGGTLVAEGVPVAARPVAVTDGADGVIVVWDSGPIRAQRLDRAGRRVWGDGGVALSQSDGVAPVAVPDSRGGAVVAWQTAAMDPDDTDLRAQSVSAAGALRWHDDGVAVCESSGQQSELVVAPGAAGSTILVWRDARDEAFGDVYAQRLDSTGTAKWAEDGVVVCDAPGFQGALSVSADGSGGVVAAWADGRDGRHIYAQRVGPGGALGGLVPSPGAARSAPHAPGAKPAKPQSR